jgi:hypothetical protein
MPVVSGRKPPSPDPSRKTPRDATCDPVRPEPAAAHCPERVAGGQIVLRRVLSLTECGRGTGAIQQGQGLRDPPDWRLSRKALIACRLPRVSAE